MNSKLKKSLIYAFPHTIPIMTGFLFLGMTYGILMRVSGFSIWIALAASVFIFAGSMQLVAVNILLSPFAPLQAFLMTLMIVILFNDVSKLFFG